MFIVFGPIWFVVTVLVIRYAYLYYITSPNSDKSLFWKWVFGGIGATVLWIIGIFFTFIILLGVLVCITPKDNSAAIKEATRIARDEEAIKYQMEQTYKPATAARQAPITRDIWFCNGNQTVNIRSDWTWCYIQLGTNPIISVKTDYDTLVSQYENAGWKRGTVSGGVFTYN